LMSWYTKRLTRSQAVRARRCCVL